MWKEREMYCGNYLDVCWLWYPVSIVGSSVTSAGGRNGFDGLL